MQTHWRARGFAKRRANALRCSVARIRGICKTLRGREYFDTIPELRNFVTEMEDLFSYRDWDRDVFTVVKEHLQRFKSWEPHKQIESGFQASMF